MPLNIKDDQVHNQAKELAALTGESITQVVRIALSERLVAFKIQQNGIEGSTRAEQLMALAKLCAENMRPNSHSSDHAEFYGDEGLPT